MQRSTFSLFTTNQFLITLIGLTLFVSLKCNASTNASIITNPKSITERINQPFIGDLDKIRERRILRVLVSYNRTNFFHTLRGDRGLEHDLMKEFEKYLNRGPRKERYRTHIVFLAHPFDQLVPNLKAGYGDIVASGLTVTPERASYVDFTRPYITDISEILISNKKQPRSKNTSRTFR